MTRFSFPKEGLYHHNDDIFDASVRNKEIMEMNRKVKNEIIYDGIPIEDYEQVLKNLEELFKTSVYLMDEIPGNRNIRKHKNNTYTAQLYGTVVTINGTEYKIHLTVLFPVSKNSQYYQPNSKIKLYHFTMKKI